MIERKCVTTPDEVVEFDHGSMHLVWVGGTTVALVTLQPGFRWTEHLRDRVGTETCQVAHTGFVSSGRVTMALDDGEEVDLGPGDVFSVPPGHDTWVVGDEPVVILDFTGDDHLAKMLDWSGA